MSKKRHSNPQLPRYLKSTISDQINPQNHHSFFKDQSFVVKKRHRTLMTQPLQQNDQKIQTLFHKNISKYRDLVNSNDKSLLPFLSSLRQSSQNINSKLNKPIKTHVTAFSVADKITCNQKIHKDLNDIKGRTKRISNALYRWHNQSGLSTKNNCFFQSKLRQTSMKFHNKDTFLNLFNRIEKPLVEHKSYKAHELICDKQKRLFTVKG